MRNVHEVEQWLNQAVSREATGDYHDAWTYAKSCRTTATSTAYHAGTKGKGSPMLLGSHPPGTSGANRRLYQPSCSRHLRTLAPQWPDDQRRRIGDVRPHVAACEHDAGLTYFERCFAIAVVLSARHPQAQFLLEVGLSDRLDCANALDYQLAIISHLGYDHCDVLGDTLQAIAGEKLAIGRDDAPMLISHKRKREAAIAASQVRPCS